MECKTDKAGQNGGQIIGKELDSLVFIILMQMHCLHYELQIIDYGLTGLWVDYILPG